MFAAFPGCGYEERKMELKAMMMGRKSLDAARMVLEALELTGDMTPEDFLSRRAAILKDLLPGATLLPGAQRLLEHLRDSGVPCCLATSSNKAHFELKTTNHRALFESVFSHMLNGDDVVKGKPHPEIFLKAKDAFPGERKPEASACLVFEDSPNGIEAAAAGGFHSVHVPDPAMAADAPAAAPSQTLKSLLDFRPQDWGLPAFPATD